MEKDVPYIVYEGTMARFERIIRRIVIVFLVVIVINNLVWLFAWNQYDYSDVTVDGTEGIANYMGGDGVINNAEDSSKKTDAQEPSEKQGNED